jgi:multiple sugar transport system permease protein
MVALTGLLVVNVLPLLWGVLTSFKPNADILRYPPRLTFAPSFEHYARVLQEGFGHNVQVSLWNTLGAVLLTLLVSIPAAYAFDRGRFALRRTLYLVVIACIPLALGASALIIPAFVWFTRLGLTDTPFVLPLIYAGYQIPMAIWIIKNAIEAVPVEVDEAAVIDGCSHFGVLWRMVLPLSRPGVGAAAILAFVGSWNEFLAGSVMVDAASLKPVQPAIYAFVGFFGREWGPLTAASTLAILPIIVAFALFGRLIISGLTGGAVKG